MRTASIAIVLAFMLAVIAGGGQVVAAAADGDQYIGTWKGTWEGAGAGGRFDLTLAKGSDGKLVASVAVGMDSGDYKAQFSKVTLIGDKLAGAYDYPPDPQGEVIITGSFELKDAVGTWSLGAKGQPGGQAIAGTWKVTKQ
jgi:hypothetical protein